MCLGNPPTVWIRHDLWDRLLAALLHLCLYKAAASKTFSTWISDVRNKGWCKNRQCSQADMDIVITLGNSLSKKNTSSLIWQNTHFLHIAPSYCMPDTRNPGKDKLAPSLSNATVYSHMKAIAAAKQRRLQLLRQTSIGDCDS